MTFTSKIRLSFNISPSLTSFTERQYTYLFSRLRTTKNNPVPLRMLAASNPGKRGHDWVKARFMIGQAPEVLRREYPDRFFLLARHQPPPIYQVASGRQASLDV